MKGDCAMRVLVTGGTGFIGRWVTKRLLDDGHQVWVIDNLANSSTENIDELVYNDHFQKFFKVDIKDKKEIETIFKEHSFDICYHLAASINVQDSIDDPEATFANDTIGTFHILDMCKRYNTKLVFMSTCMVYDRAQDESGITEDAPIKPASPYAGSKIAAENMVLSYYYAYGLPVVVIRPFNTYGPFQKTGGEGGVVAIFIKNDMAGQPLSIYGDGTQTRDLLYVEDCADFVVRAGYSSKADGQIINAGTGKDITINDLAQLITKDTKKINHVEHIHPQSEIPKLLCNSTKAKQLLGWEAQITLEEGIERTRKWIQSKENGRGF